MIIIDLDLDPSCQYIATAPWYGAFPGCLWQVADGDGDDDGDGDGDGDDDGDGDNYISLVVIMMHAGLFKSIIIMVDQDRDHIVIEK